MYSNMDAPSCQHNSLNPEVVVSLIKPVLLQTLSTKEIETRAKMYLKTNETVLDGLVQKEGNAMLKKKKNTY